MNFSGLSIIRTPLFQMKKKRSSRFTRCSGDSIQKENGQPSFFVLVFFAEVDFFAEVVFFAAVDFLVPVDFFAPVDFFVPVFLVPEVFFASPDLVAS